VHQNIDWSSLLNSRKDSAGSSNHLCSYALIRKDALQKNCNKYTTDQVYY